MKIRPALAALVIAFAVAHLPFLPASLEDIDSVNFALGIRDFDVALHRPHPPGYPVYIALGKVAVAVGGVLGSTGLALEARAMAWLSLGGGVLAIVWLYCVLACLSSAGSDRSGPPWRVLDARALAATALATACPMFWYMAARPMSDVPGLAAALAALACLMLAWWRQRPDPAGDRRLTSEQVAASGRMIVLGSLLAAVAIGFRSQTALLTLPLLFGVLVDRIGRGVAGVLVGGGVAFCAGVAVWAVPLVLQSGGLNAYLAALGSQAGEDFAGVPMLYTNPSARMIAIALLRTFIYPWDSIALGTAIIALAAVGVVALAIRDRRALAALILLSGPYLVFHLLFQEMTFVRYALPLVAPVAYLAVCGLELVARRAALPVVAVLTLWPVAMAAPVLAAYGAEASPTARAVQAMRDAFPASAPGALAMHQTFQRPLEAESLPAGLVQLPSPPRREWLELVRYWRDGHREPLWLLADPRRSDLALVDPASRRDRTEFGWRFQSLSEMGGMRPGAVTWYRMPPPGWFAEEGWALTPETAGIAREMGRGPDRGPITAWVRRRAHPARLLVGGRHLGSEQDPPARFTTSIDGTIVATWDAPAGFFLHVFDVPAGLLEGNGGGTSVPPAPLARLTIQSTAGGSSISTAIEQFDLQDAGTLLWGYDRGWHEAEYDPAIGVWRWTSDRAALRIVDARSPVTIRLRIESPLGNFDAPATLKVTAAGVILGERRISDTVAWEIPVPLDALTASGGLVTIETDRVFVPAASGGPDQRRLGLRVFAVDVIPR